MSYVLPAGDVDEDVLPPPDGVDSSWVRERGGGDASGAVYSVTLQGKSEVAVTLTGLDVVGVRPLDPPEDVVVLTRCHGGGDLYPRRFSIDLDAPQPRVEALAGDRDEPGDGAEDPMSFPYFVSSTTPEVFWIGASSTKCFCEWSLELRWSAEGKTGVVPLKLDDRMFVTAPVRGDEPRYLYWEDGTLDRLQ